MIVPWGTGHMCGFSGSLAIWLPCVAGSEFGVRRRQAGLNLGSLMLGCLGIQVSDSWSLGVELFGWVVSQVLGVGVPVPGCGRNRVCQHKDIPVSLDPEVGVSRCLGVLRLMGVWECSRVVSSCGAAQAAQVPGCLGVGTQVSRCGVSMYPAVGCACIGVPRCL